MCFDEGFNCFCEGGIGCCVKLFKIFLGIKLFILVKKVLFWFKILFFLLEFISLCFILLVCGFLFLRIGKIYGELGVFVSLFFVWEDCDEFFLGDMCGDLFGFIVVEMFIFEK